MQIMGIVALAAVKVRQSVSVILIKHKEPSRARGTLRPSFGTKSRGGARFGIGRVTPDGAYRASSVGTDGVRLTATGRMSGSNGSGLYRRADGCNGRWVAKKY
jgi:hypothetical protein